ncbi:MAG TPA: hypothetical protein VEF89_22370 [Solirubrobacteraceae bacterium]|nr:hypothetical protein [Solirubrobacteraceae bacterium]
MRPRSRLKLVRTILVTAGAFAVTGCADTNRVATLNLATPGATVATTLKKQLAVKGFPTAKVTCSKTLDVNVGTTDTCRVTGAGTNRAVQFTFSNYTGKIKLSSVKTS